MNGLAGEPVSSAVFVLNPNSSVATTETIARAIRPLAKLGVVKCLGLVDGPDAIETDEHVEAAVEPILRKAADLESSAAAFVVACFSDPGLHELRNQSAKPVLGIAESGFLTALAFGQKVGILSILDSSIDRHRRYFSRLGVLDKIAGDRALGLGVAQLSDHMRTLERLCHVGRLLRDEDEADVLLLGCAGLADCRDELSAVLGLPVVEPCQAAVAMAFGRAGLSRGGSIFPAR